MSYKVVRDAQGNPTGAWGLNDGHYEPTVPAGCTLCVEDAPPVLPTFQDMTVLTAADVDVVTAKRIRALIGGVDPIQEQLKGLRQVAWAEHVKANPGDFSQADQDKASTIIAASLTLNEQIEAIRAEGKAFKQSKGWA